MSESSKNSQSTVFFLLIIGLTVIDIALDFNAGINIKHLVVEFIVLFVSLVGFNFYLGRLQSSEKKKSEEIGEALKEAKASKGQIETLKQELGTFKKQFKDEIDEQFKAWKFTKAETEVAVLLLKGMSLKEISDLREANEKTVRTQCTSIYKKSNLKGRHQLSSYFLDFIF